MEAVHIIDEVVFDASFDSIHDVHQYESGISSWLTGQLLVEVDSVLNEFDDAETVLRLGLVEIDLGNVPYQLFHTEVIRRTREKLSDLLRDLRESDAQSRPDQMLSISRISQAHSDLERFVNFLMTGYMDWHIKTSDMHIHEQMLERVLQGAGDEFIEVLRQFASRNTLVNRLVNQFSEQSLVNILHKIVPSHASLILDFIVVYRLTITDTHFSSVNRTVDGNLLWESVFNTLLETSKPSDDQADLVITILKKFASSHRQDSLFLIKMMSQMATRLVNGGKIDSTLSKILFDALNVSSDLIESEREYPPVRESHQPIPFTAASITDSSQFANSMSPHQKLQRIYQALRNGELSLSSVRISSAELHQLISVHILNDPVFGSGDRTAFIQAIEIYAARAKEKEKYYRQILEALLHGQLVDLEAALVQSDYTTTSIAIKDDLINLQVPWVETLPLSETNKQAGDINLTAVYQRIADELLKLNIAGIQGIAAEKLQQQPDTIKQLLQHCGVHAQTRRQLVSQLPENILIDITYIFSPQAAAIISQFLEQSKVLYLSAGQVTQISKANWESQLWEGNLTYLLTEMKGAFDTSAYIKALARMMSTFDNKYTTLHAWYDGLSAAQTAEGLQKILKHLIVHKELPVEYVASQSDFRQNSEPYVNANELQQLIIGYIQNTPVPGSGDRTAFIKAIETYAERATEKEIYYRQIMEALLQNQLVDLEAILMQANAIRDIAKIQSESSSAASTSGAIYQQSLSARYESHELSQGADFKEALDINNAGQVLAAPYLPRFFGMMKLVENGAFINRQSAERAVHLLQFMVNGQCESPEYQLVLNKILCGISTGIPISKGIDISEHEKRTVESLIQGMIQNWKIIGNTSIEGLRETFLQRRGRLLLKDDAWHLTIQPGPFDMLLDSLPWKFSVIKHSWMDRAIHVNWR